MSEWKSQSAKYFSSTKSEFRFTCILDISLADMSFIQVGVLLALVCFLFRMMFFEWAIKTEHTRQGVCLAASPACLVLVT